MKTAVQSAVTRFGLFGESAGAGDPEFFHIEDIQSRSRLYRWQIAPHAHTRMFQIIWLDSGPATIGIDGREQSLTGPLAICIPGSVVHSFVFDERSSGHVVTVSEAILAEASGQKRAAPLDMFQREPMVLAFADDGTRRHVCSLLELMAQEYAQRAYGREQVFFWQLQSLLVLLQRRAAQGDVPSGKAGYRRNVFVSLEKLIEEQFRMQWNTDDYARALAIGSQRLNRIALEFSGRTVVELAHERTMLEAQRHLVYTAAPIEAIAWELGFNDLGSGLIDQSQKITAAAMQIAYMNVCAHLS